MKESPALRQLGALVSGTLPPATVPINSWPAILQLSLGHGLAPMLLWTVKQNAPELVTEPLWTPVIMSTRLMGVRYLELETTRKQVSVALSEAQIPALWLKGIALAQTVYPQPVLRPMGDLDVLVPYDMRENALRIVEGLGYHFYETNGQLMSTFEVLETNMLHHYHLRGGISDSIILEVHFRLLGTDNKLLSLEKLDWFWTQTNSLQNGSQFTILQPEAHLLYMSAHAILQHGEASTLLRQYFDLHRLIQQVSMDWDKVIRQSDTFGWNYAVERALTLSCQYFSTPIPDSVWDRLRLKSADPGAIRAKRLQGRGARWEGMLMRLQRLSFADKVRLVFKVVLPPQSYMRVRYELSPDRRVWPHYIRRWVYQGKDISWAVWNRISDRVRKKDKR